MRELTPFSLCETESPHTDTHKDDTSMDAISRTSARQKRTKKSDEEKYLRIANCNFLGFLVADAAEPNKCPTPAFSRSRSGYYTLLFSHVFALCFVASLFIAPLISCAFAKVLIASRDPSP